MAVGPLKPNAEPDATPSALPVAATTLVTRPARLST